jgi:hypothetical protein
MRYMLLALLAAFSFAEAIAFEGAIDMKVGCKNNPQVVGACYSVRGRLSAYNGTPSLRIWPIGTHRLLGVLKDEEPLSVPNNIRDLVGFDRAVYADFLVCPLTKSTPGQMQDVCVEAASNVHVQNLP